MSSIPRTAHNCERYLDRLALVVVRAGTDAYTFLPLILRLQRELALIETEERAISQLKSRFASRRVSSASDDVLLKR